MGPEGRILFTMRVIEADISHASCYTCIKAAIAHTTVLDSRGKAITEGSDARMRYPWAQRDGNQI